MTGRRVIFGLCVLCALALSAFMAQGASAAVKGTTLYTCKKATVPGPETTEGFKDEHCKEPTKNTKTELSNVKYEHFAIAQGTLTEVTGTNSKTKVKEEEEETFEPTILKSTISGVNVELESAIVHITNGSVTNVVNGLEHRYIGSAKLAYTKVKVKAPAGKECKVKGEEVTTNELTGTSTEMEEQFAPSAGETFAEFEVEGCTGSEAIKALNGVYKVTGSVKCPPSGATLICTHSATTAQGSLKLRGQKAGIEGSLTIKGTEKAAGDVTDTPLSPTTVET